MLPPQGRLTLYGSAQWTTRLRTLLALLWGEMEDPESPVLWYLGLLLQYAQKEYLAQGGSMSRPHNETVDQDLRIPHRPLPAKALPSRRWQRSFIFPLTISAACSGG